MSLFLAKKQEDLNQKKVRDLLRLKENKKCFDCPTKSPFFVNTTIQTFICARCSGLVREVGHRVKSISASKFSGAELLALKEGGNGVALKIWLSNYSTHDSPEPESDADVRAFMKQKYYENKWLDRVLLQSHMERVRTLIAKSFNEDGLPIVTKSRTMAASGFSRVPLIADSEMNMMNSDYEDEQYQLDNNFSVPVVTSPHNNASTVFPAPSATVSRIERASMESTYSAFSVKSFGSAHSQREQKEDYISENRRSVSNSYHSSNSSRNSMDSTHFSTASGISSGSSIASNVEETDENCRMSIDSNISHSSFAKEQSKEDTSITVKSLPPLQINIFEANSEFIQYQQQQQLKSSVPNDADSNSTHCIKNSKIVSPASASQVVTQSTSNPQKPSNTFDSIIMELSGLKLEKVVRKATYTGGILSPASVVSPLTSSSSINALKPGDGTKFSAAPLINPSIFPQFQATTTTTKIENDPYAALRGIPSPAVSDFKEELEQVTHTIEEAKEFEFPQDDDFDEDSWQGFCSASSVEENDEATAPIQVIQGTDIVAEKPVITLDFFRELDPRAMFKCL